jgi:hypothetical protein
MFIPMTTMFLLTEVLSGIWPTVSPIYAQIKNQTVLCQSARQTRVTVQARIYLDLLYSGTEFIV